MRPTDAADEPPIDTSLNHYMEERALTIAAEKAGTPEALARVRQLMALRQALLLQRAAFMREATARRHARGEIYSKARVAAINAMGAGQAQMERDVQALYLEQPDAVSVLKAHAQTHFAFVLVSSRVNLSACTPDIAPAARALQEREEAFARAWVAAIGEAAFDRELRENQREALRSLRTSTRPMHLVSYPASEPLDDADAFALGKAWNKLDELAQALGVEPLSAFITLPDEGPGGAVPAQSLLLTVEALLADLQDRAREFPSRKAATAALSRVQRVLSRLAGVGGQACFEVDT